MQWAAPTHGSAARTGSSSSPPSLLIFFRDSLTRAGIKKGRSLPGTDSFFLALGYAEGRDGSDGISPSMSVTRHRRARNGLVSPNQGLGEVCGNHPKSQSPLHRQTLPTQVLHNLIIPMFKKCQNALMRMECSGGKRNGLQCPRQLLRCLKCFVVMGQGGRKHHPFRCSHEKLYADQDLPPGATPVIQTLAFGMPGPEVGDNP